MRDDDFIFGLSSDYLGIMVESSLYWRKQFKGFSADILNSEFRGRRSIC